MVIVLRCHNANVYKKYWKGLICSTVNPRATPCEQKLDYSDDAEEMSDVTKYREAVGSLIYMATCTRPDLSFVVSKLSQYFAKLENCQACFKVFKKGPKTKNSVLENTEKVT